MNPSSRDELLRRISSGDLLLLGKAISPQRMYAQSPPVHKEIASAFLNRSLKLLNIIAPRGLAKTTLVTLYVLYHVFVEKTTSRKFVVIVSKTQGHAKSILGTIKDIIDYSQGFRALFGYHGEQVSKQWRDDMIELDTGDGIATRGTRQPMRGINLKMQRPTLVIVDDPEDENNTKTKEAMEQNLFYLLQSIEPSVDARDGRVIVIGTPLHELCIVQKLSEMGTYKTLFFQNSIEKGIALWPEMKPLEWLIEKRDSLNDIGLVRSYYQEYECTLIPGGDQMFKPDYFQYYDSECHIEHDRENDAYFVNPKNGVRIPVNIYMGIDPASSIQQSADYSTIVPIAMDKDENIYVLDYFRRRVTPLELADNIEAYFHRYKPNLTTIESVGYQEMLRNYLRSRIFIPGLEIKENPRQSKSSRLEMLQPFFAQKKVWMKKEHRELVEELIMFPKGKHEDTLDGLYYAVKRARAASHGSDDGDTREALPEHLQVYVEYFEEEEKDSSIPTYYDPFE